MMKKFWAILLLCFLSVTSFGALFQECSSCTATSSTHCKEDVSKVQTQSSCHALAPVEKKSCCSSDRETVSDDCHLWSAYDHSVVSEKRNDVHVEPKFQCEGLLVQVTSFISIAKPEKKQRLLELRTVPFVSSLTFLKTIRLLC